MAWWGYKPYVSVAQRQAKAAKEVAKLARKGRTISPVKIDGRKIAATFWGEAWCDHMESHSDFASRLPRGRTYVRNGSVVDLQIAAGKVTALVSGSELYHVTINIKPLASSVWDCIRRDCSGKIGSLIELLQGKFGNGVMEIVTRKSTGVFPSPKEIEMDCSCPDWAGMCKHIAAVFYGIGARLDSQPDLLFTLRKVNHLDLIAAAGDAGGLSQGSSDHATIADESLEDVFGIELDAAAKPIAPSSISSKKKPAKKPAGAKKNLVRPKNSRPVKSGGRSKKNPRSSSLNSKRKQAKAI